MTKTDKIILALGAIAIASAAIVGGISLTKTSSNKQSTGASQTSTNDSQTATTATTGSASQSNTSTEASSGYKDGTYTASASYSVPHNGSNSIAVTLTVKDGVITAVNADNSYTDHESSEYIDMFEQALEGQVVGQSVASLSPSRIGGASLTTDGFNDALDTIRSQAQA